MKCFLQIIDMNGFDQSSLLWPYLKVYFTFVSDVLVLRAITQKKVSRPHLLMPFSLLSIVNSYLLFDYLNPPYSHLPKIMIM